MTITQSRSGQLILSIRQFEAVGFKNEGNDWMIPIPGTTMGHFKVDTIIGYVVNDGKRWYLKVLSKHNNYIKTDLNIPNKDTLFKFLDVLRVKYYLLLLD